MAVTHPLVALDAVVIDTETTGLDPAKARVLQIGAVRIVRGRLLDTPALDIKINPGVPIPVETTRIHGLDAAMLQDAPPFEAAFPALAEFVGAAILIGHNIGFDSAILERETELCGARALDNRMLDTRILGEICFPRLGGFTLDRLASHLGLPASNRHNALADARLTGEVFLALLPSLRAHGIRTLEEAEFACRRMTAVLDEYNRAGWHEPVRARNGMPQILGRIDAFPFRHRVRDVASMPPAYVGPSARLDATIGMMADKGISSVFVSAVEGELAAPVGIVTERDVIRLIGNHGAAGLNLPVGEIASRPLQTVPADAFIYRAIGRMERLHIRHLGVVDEDGAMIGALSARDLLKLRASDALALGDAVDSAEGTGDLAAAWSRIPRVARRLLDEGVTAGEVAAVISREIGAMTRSAARDAEARMIAEGHGPAPAPYAVLILGSAARGESLLIPDQDNATIHAGSDPAADIWFLRHGALMNAMLDTIGIPLCKGGVMAGNAIWNGNLDTWRARVTGWTETVDPEDLLAVDIFYDFRHVDGDPVLAATLRTQALAAAHTARPMIKLLANQLQNWSPPVGFLGRITLENGRVDLKKGGLFPIVAAARCLCLSHGIAARGTSERLAALKAEKVGAEVDLDMLAAAHTLLMRLILEQQLTDIALGLPPSTRVEPGRLSRTEQAALKDCLGSLDVAPTLVRDLLFAH